MRCPQCDTANREGRKFCASCGSPLAAACRKCGASNLPGEQFCGECGAVLSAPGDPAVATAVEPLDVHAGERRHLTILFCDLVGSTTLTAQLDPEEWRATVAGYQRAAAEAITRFGGDLVRYVGDGIMAFFGYPAAHDNDAERAARAGLAILDAIAQLNEQPAHTKLAVRIGIDSGQVVVGAGAGKEVDAFGDTANIAARVQAAAEPDTVVVTGDTHRLISGLFIVEELGAQTLKGIERPIQLYRIVRPSGMRGRLAAAAATRALTHFVGREDELRLLQSRWERVVEGEGQVITIVGEAGIGKSRLVQEFRDRIVAERHTWLECATAAFFQNTPFYAVADMLQQTFHWHSNQNNERRPALEASLAATGIEIDEGVPLIAALLGLPLGDKYPPLRMPPDQQRKRLLATLVAWTFGSAKAQPLVIATEDLHWADPSTLELIELLVEQGATARLLLLYTARPEFRAARPLRAHHTQLTLNRLSARQVRTMVGEIGAQKALSDGTIAAVVERTSGVPLFVEELTQAVLESGDATLTGREIPATLHDSLMARLDRLGPAKEVAQVGAVLGSEFSYELLHAVHPTGEADLQRALRSLTNAELLYVRGIAPEATYQFKHALIRDAAYEALLKSRRKELHFRVARTIDEQFPVIKETHPEVLARHWSEAGEVELAIAAWQRAGDLAVARSAMAEATHHLTRALESLSELTESPERDSRELDLRQTMLVVLRLSRGYAATETIAATQLVARIAEKGGDVSRLSQSSGAQFLAALHVGSLSAARAFADRALDSALRARSTSLVASAHSFQVIARHHCGDLVGSERNFSAWSEVCNDAEYERLVEAKIATLAMASRNAWMLGLADTARKREASMMNAGVGANPYRTALSSCRGAQLRVLLRDYGLADELARRAVELAEEYDFPHLRPTAYCILGRARAERGQVTEGIALVRQGIVAAVDSGLRLGFTNFYLLLAEVQLLDGATKKALEAVEQALQMNPDQREDRPEAQRVRGELHLNLGQPGLGERDIRDAISSAARMSAKAWELRSAMSLTRFLSATGRSDEARAMLAEIYGWFTEGFDLPDLKDAKALLDELSG